MVSPALYARVSSREQVEGYSLDAQIRAARAYCQARGWPEPTIYADEGRSAYTDVTEQRPRFAAMLDAAQAGRHTVIIVHKLDRFARSVVVTLRELRRLERAGVKFVSLGEDGMDFTTPIGGVLLTMLAAFAEYYSKNLSAETKKGLVEKEAQGLHVGGIPYGALRIGGRLCLDPAHEATLALILDLSRERAPQAVAQHLNRAGIPAPKAASWWPQTIRRIVVGGDWLAAQPDPWPARWRLAAARPPLPRFALSEAKPHPLSGLLRCGCGGAVQYSRAWVRLDGATVHTVRCRRRIDRAETAPCPGGKKTHAEVYEALVEAWFRGLADRLATGRGVAPPDGLAVRAALAERRRLLVLALAEGLPEAEYRKRRAALDREEALLPPVSGHETGLLVEIAIARAGWDRLGVAERNAIYRLLIRQVIIRGHAVVIVPSDALAPLLPPA